jgi:hypothetical protein
MVWRQSYDRCLAMTYDSEPHLFCRVHEVIRGFWERRPEQTLDSSTDFFKACLMRLPKKHGYVRELLWTKWRDLRLAIEECAESGYSVEEMPFAIPRVFLRRASKQKSPAERILAEQEEIRK